MNPRQRRLRRQRRKHRNDPPPKLTESEVNRLSALDRQRYSADSAHSERRAELSAAEQRERDRRARLQGRLDRQAHKKAEKSAARAKVATPKKKPYEKPAIGPATALTGAALLAQMLPPHPLRVG